MVTNRRTATVHCAFARVRVLLLAIAILILCPFGGTSAMAQGVRVETKEQIINQRQIGWERVLTDKDPNLSHWHWEPITNAYRQVQVRRINEPGQRHAVLKEPLAAQHQGGQYPIGTSSSLRVSADGNGKIIRQAPVSAPLAKPTVYTYGTLLRSPSHLDSEQQRQTRVAGKIIRVRNSNI
jgi:hypothetical protein